MRKQGARLIILGIVVMLVMALAGSACCKSPLSTGELTICKEELVTLTDTSMVVTWATDEPSDTMILWDTSPELGNTAYGEATNDIYHYMELTGLEPGTKYYYRVCSTTDDDREGIGHLRSFTTLTPPDGDYLFSFATMNDTHIGRDWEWNEEAEDLTALAAVNEINGRGVAFTIIKGDITDHGLYGALAGQQDEFGDAKEIFDALEAVYYPVIGNHDIWPYDPSNPEYNEGPIGNVVFMDTFDLDSTYYSFDYEGYRFICMDSVSRDPASGDDPGARGGGEIWDKDNQMSWLENELDSAQSEGQRVMIFMHHPITETADATAISLSLFNFTVDDDDAREFRELIGQYDNVIGVFSGHTHRNLVTYARESGSMPYPETGATVEYPCGYTIYQVYTNGYMQSFYKCKLLDLSERTRSTIGSGILESIEVAYKFGGLEDRNFVYMFGD